MPLESPGLSAARSKTGATRRSTIPRALGPCCALSLSTGFKHDAWHERLRHLLRSASSQHGFVLPRTEYRFVLQRPVLQRAARVRARDVATVAVARRAHSLAYRRAYRAGSAGRAVAAADAPSPLQPRPQRADLHFRRHL